MAGDEFNESRSLIVGCENDAESSLPSREGGVIGREESNSPKLKSGYVGRWPRRGDSSRTLLKSLGGTGGLGKSLFDRVSDEGEPDLAAPLRELDDPE